MEFITLKDLPVPLGHTLTSVEFWQVIDLLMGDSLDSSQPDQFPDPQTHLAIKEYLMTPGNAMGQDMMTPVQSHIDEEAQRKLIVIDRTEGRLFEGHHEKRERENLLL